MIIIVVMHELASAFLIADRMFLVDKVKIVALGAVDSHRVAPREDCVTYIFGEGQRATKSRRPLPDCENLVKAING